ncbi:unnamed protein product [Microthlaspi erraticum]|uniref:TIR domain-containing protein n=1 Tax=Microthlaspi erraticum TaxID=1685480 RepID=A0A6D2KYN1_9BRAS|nr:unnamed protein product [Microthlaspi erraticum]
MDNNKNDEVFLSFDHRDSSVSSFISYLIAAFNRQGISAVFDGKSSHVEAVEREEEERFSKLKVFVVVFSDNYVSHVPRLEKHLYSCRNNDDFVVVPVFYRVSTWSVKQHIENSCDVYEAVQISMPKLRRGHEYDGTKTECEFLEEIARDVFEELYPTEEIGIQSSVLKIERLLCKQPWGVRSIGLFGEAGIGKTTLARAVFRRMSGGYDDSCFIKDFQTEYSEKRLEYLPTEYFGKTPMEKFDLNSSGSVPSYRKKRVLVALDDVGKSRDAKSFLGGFDRFSPGSLIIITSRSKKVLQECHMNEIYEVKGLSDKDALKLFTRCAFGKDDTEENLSDHSSMKAIKCCDGNPSALRSYAKEFMVKATTKMEPALPDACEVVITGHIVSCDIVKNTYVCTIPCKEDDEMQEKKESPSDHNDVLATTDTIVLTGLITRDTSDRWFYRLDYDSVKSLFKHLCRKRHILHQRLARQLQKFLQRFSNTSDHDLPELLLNFSDGDIKVVRKKNIIESYAALVP